MSHQKWCEAAVTAEANAQAKMAERAAWMHTPRRDQNTFFNHASAATFQVAMLLAPYYPCFWTLEKKPSVREVFDGGKWLCGLPELDTTSRPCVVYSLGSDYDTSFEEHVSSQTSGRCEFFIYDPTLAQTRSQQALDAWRAKLPRNFHVHDTALTGGNVSSVVTGRMAAASAATATAYNNSLPLVEAMRRNGHGTSATILKFDIEGWENELINSVPWTASGLQFGLLLFELHASPTLLDLPRIHAMFGLLEAAGYRLYSAEPVFGGYKGTGPRRQVIGAGQLEVAFVHRDWSPHSGFSRPCHEPRRGS